MFMIIVDIDVIAAGSLWFTAYHAGPPSQILDVHKLCSL